MSSAPLRVLLPWVDTAGNSPALPEASVARADWKVATACPSVGLCTSAIACNWVKATKQDPSTQGLGRQLTAYDRSIDVHISAIRQKLGMAPDGQSWIRNLRGFGYQLVVMGI